MNMGSSSPLDAKLVEKKLQNLSNTRESIQTLSMWAISHKAQHEQIVSIWFQVLKTAKIELRLCLFYLCNDIVQTCRREHAVVFKDAFKEVLKDAALLVRDASVRSSVKRIFKIWLERKVYDEAFVKELLATLYNTKVKSSLSSKLLAGFHPENLKKSIIEMTELEEHVEVQRAELSDPIWTAEEVDAHKQEMKNRGEGEELVRKMERIRSEYEKYVASLEKEGSQRKELILTLELSELFYDAQLGECNILTTAYKTYTMKLNQVKKRLWEFLHPEEKEKDQLKKVRKRKKSKSIDLDEATTPPLPITSTVEVSHHNGPILIQSVKGAETLPPALSPPPPPSELWGVPSVAPVMKEVHRFHHFQADHQPNQLHNESNFYQQHQELQQQQQQLQQQQQYHPPVTLLQSQIQQLSHSFSATTAPITPKVSNAVADDCYEMNHYEIGGEEGTPVYDEDIMESGDATPVQDEDPADGYIPSKERKASRPGLDNSKDHSSQPGVFMGVRNPGPLGMPIGCLPTTPDITRPPPPLNIFFSPPGMIKSTTPGSMGDKEKSLVDAPQGQSLHPQIMQMPPGMFSIVGMPIPSSIASPTLPQFGMIPFAGAALPSQQQQLAQGQPNFNLLPAMGQTQLMPQLAISGPFSQQIMSPPPMVNPLQTIQQQQQQSQQPQQVSQRQFQKFSNIRPLMLMSDNQKRPEFRGNPSPSLSSSSIPTLERSTSANEAHYQSLIPTTTTNHNNNNNNNNDYSTLPRGRARDHFKDGESADKRSRPRINQNNLTHVKTMEHSNVAGYTVPETNL